MKSDSLGKALDSRPEREVLVGRNILPEEAGVSPALVERQRELDRSMRSDSLGKALGARPEREELVKEGILRE